MYKCNQLAWFMVTLVVGLYEVVEDHQEEEDDANDVGEHGKLDIRDHLCW